MLANYHTHTARCHHAFGEDRAYVEAAIAAGLQVLGFTDHCPWVFPDGFVSDMRMTPGEVDGYFYALESLRREYARDITIYIGFEAEYLPRLMDAQDAFLAQYPVDYLILGQHFLDSEATGPYTGHPSDQEFDLLRYVTTIIEAMESGRYRYVAHPDLCHYMGDDAIYRREYLRLCEYLRHKGIPVEINLLGIADGRHYTSRRFLEIAQEVGNQVLIACDAHTPDALHPGDALQWATQTAQELGLEIVDYLPGLTPKHKTVL